MSSLKHLFQNGLIKAMFIGMIILSLLCALTVKQQFEKMDWTEQMLSQYEWVIPLGMYDEISAAEIGDTVYFLAGSGEEGNREYTVYVWDGTSLKNDAQWENMQVFLSSHGGNRLTRNVHPAGYWISRKSGVSEREYVTDMEGSRLTSNHRSYMLQLTEQPGYVINRENNTVISLENQDVIYKALENERIMNQRGDYWIMERDIPWPHGVPLTIMYLRNMDFSMALDGMLFDSVYEVEDGKICGTVITTGTYDVLPEEVIAVEERIVEADGSWTPLFADASDGMILSAGDGYYVTQEWSHEESKTQTIIHFLDGRESAVIENWMDPIGPCRNGFIAFQYQKDLKEGFMDASGVIVAEPIFSNCSYPHLDTAVVVHYGQMGVLHLKGGEGNE